jgi:hypothetical protein
MRASQLIHDDPQAQGKLRQWAWRAVTALLWLALLQALAPSAWSMLQALYQWTCDLSWRHWLGASAIAGLLLTRALRAARRPRNVQARARQWRYLEHQQWLALGKSRVILATHDSSGQLAELRAMPRPVLSKVSAKNPIRWTWPCYLMSLLLCPLVRPLGAGVQGGVSHKRDSMYYICAPP